jgi:beta-N-acetylhexosaminidase
MSFLNDVRSHLHLPLFFSADAEPTLVNRKIIGSQKVPYTNSIHSTDSVEIIASIISEDLNKIGINQNYAPVIDASPTLKCLGNFFFISLGFNFSFSNEFIIFDSISLI